MDLKYFNKVTLFSDLDKNEIGYFIPCLKKHTFVKGEIIIEKGDQSDLLYILYTGEVAISRKITMLPDLENMHKTFKVLRGDEHTFFGEIGLLGFAKRTATVEAVADSVLYTLSHSDFQKICDKHPATGLKVSLQISHQLSSLLQRNNEDILKLTTALIYALK